MLCIKHGVTFSVANVEALVRHVAVRVEDNGHDIPGRRELGWGDVAAVCAQEVPLICRYAVVDLDVVVSAVGVVLQLEVVEGEEDGRALGHHDQPGAVYVVGIRTWEVWTGDIPRWSGEDSSTFHSFHQNKEKHLLNE